jgi:hypothetical protein
MKSYKILAFAAITVLMASCEDSLDTKPVNQWTDENIWLVPELAEGVLMDVYRAVPTRPDNFDNNFLDAATDNAAASNFSSNVYKAGIGSITAGDNPLGNWDACYNQLQTIHLFMEKGLVPSLKYDRVTPETDAKIKTRLKGEAFFLRAWWSFNLLQRHGGKSSDGRALGYPIVTHFISDEEGRALESYTRNTYQECVRQIIADCDSAIARLPIAYTGADVVTGDIRIGRASAAAAAALKSRVTLYGASPAYQDDAVVKITGMGQFIVTGQSIVQQQWERAALVSDTVLRMAGFGAFYGIKATDLADAPTTTPSEFLWRKFFNNNAMEVQHFPPFYRGSAQTIPSQNLVSAFPAKNGFPITDSRSLYSANNPNPVSVPRDNRLDLNVYYQGRTFATNSGTIDVVYGAKDSESFHRNGSRTGHYLAKFMSKKDNMLNPLQMLNSIHYHPLLRKGEVFLNYAEAANEAWGPYGKGAGCLYSAYDVIKMIRQASGGITSTTYLDELAANKETFRALIQNERRIELAFENHRFFDMRRCLLNLNEPLKGIEVTRNDGGSLTYTEKQVEPRNMNEIKYYYLPLPNGELLKNKNLVNNIGW